MITGTVPLIPGLTIYGDGLNYVVPFYIIEVQTVVECIDVMAPREFVVPKPFGGQICI